jgi:hypothetical protein
LRANAGTEICNVSDEAGLLAALTAEEQRSPLASMFCQSIGDQTDRAESYHRHQGSWRAILLVFDEPFVDPAAAVMPTPDPAAD